jgi:hypothetical protein
MYDTSEIVIFTALGLVFAVGVAILGRWSKQDPIRVCAYALIASAFLFVGLALRSDNPGAWLGIELTGVAIFGSLALLSIVASPWFVFVGLALHPLWSIVFHFVGTGSAFTPGPFALAVAGFDGALALYALYCLITDMRSKPAPQIASAQAGRRKERAR